MWGQKQQQLGVRKASAPPTPRGRSVGWGRRAAKAFHSVSCSLETFLVSKESGGELHQHKAKANSQQNRVGVRMGLDVANRRGAEALHIQARTVLCGKQGRPTGYSTGRELGVR